LLVHAHHISWSTIPDVNRGILPKVLPDYAKATILSKHLTAVINQNHKLLTYQRNQLHHIISSKERDDLFKHKTRTPFES
jgi:hypothetical protein